MSTDTRRLELGSEGLPDLPLLMLCTLDALRATGGSATNGELLDLVVEREAVTEEEQSWLMPNGRTQRLHYYLSWARTYLKRGGAVDNSSRGVWSLTESGEHMRDIEAMQAIHQQVTEEEKQRAKLKRDAQSAAAADPSALVSEEMGLSANALLGDDDEKSAWRDALIEALLRIKPEAFERLSQRLMREAGFIRVEVRGRSNDGGIDGIGTLRVNLVSFQVLFQCKRWKGSIGSSAIRDFRGAMQGRADKGLFITTSSFTKQATDEASRDGAIAIDLIDGDRLCDLLLEYQLGVKTETVTVTQHKVQHDWLRDI